MSTATLSPAVREVLLSDYEANDLRELQWYARQALGSLASAPPEEWPPVTADVGRTRDVLDWLGTRFGPTGRKLPKGFRKPRTYAPKCMACGKPATDHQGERCQRHIEKYPDTAENPAWTRVRLMFSLYGPIEKIEG